MKVFLENKRVYLDRESQYDTLLETGTVTLDSGTVVAYSEKDVYLYPAHDGTEVSVSETGTSTDKANYITIDGVEYKIGGEVKIDNESISTNTYDELQAVGIIDQKTGNANKYWTGTIAEFDAIQTKDTNTIYIITDDEVINIGSTTTTIETVVYPTITKAKLDEIYARYTTGNLFVLLWQPLGINTYFSVVYASDVDAYELHMIIHGKVAKYSWNNQTSGLVIPTLI